MKFIFLVVFICVLQSGSAQFDSSLEKIHRIGLITSTNFPLNAGSFGASGGLLYETKMFPKLYLSTSLVFSQQNYLYSNPSFKNLEWSFFVSFLPFKDKISPVFAFGGDIKKRAIEDKSFTPFMDYIIGLEIHAKKVIINPGIRYSDFYFIKYDVFYFFCNFKISAVKQKTL